MPALVTEWADGLPWLVIALIALSLFGAWVGWRRPDWLLDIGFLAVAAALMWVPLHFAGVV